MPQGNITGQIVRVAIPPDADLEIEQTGPLGHYDIRGAAGELERYLALDFRAKAGRLEARER